MTFLTPAFAWALLSLIPLAAIYFLKVRPRRKPTTAYFLWEKVFTEKRSSALFKRLRDLWSLLLMLLAFAAICTALMQPELEGDDRRDLLIVIDTSASMSVEGGGGKRFEEAVDRARAIVRALDGAQRASIATVADELTFVSHLTDSPRELMEALEQVRPTNLPLDRASLARLYETSDSKWAESYRILFLTDGSSDGGQVPSEIEIVKIGDAEGNLGIAAADLQILPGEEPTLGLYIQVASSFREPQNADLILRLRGSPAIARLIPLTVAPGLNPPEVITIEGYEPGEYLVTLDVEDALEADNGASLVAHKPRPIPVSVDSRDRFFLENSVLAFTRSGGLLALVEDNAQLAIAKGAPADVAQALVFQPQGESKWWQSVGEELEGAVPRVLLEDHPVLRLLDASTIQYDGARKLEAPEGALVLVAADDDTPLIYVSHMGGQSAVVVNMDPAAAEFYFSAWFPVLVHGVATHLAGREDELLSVYPSGSESPIPGVAEEDVTAVTAPDGSKSEVIGKRYPVAGSLGFHEFDNKSGHWPIGVSLLARGESLIDNTEIADTAKPISTGWAPAYLLTVLALIVLVIESILYHRRKVG